MGYQAINIAILQKLVLPLAIILSGFLLGLLFENQFVKRLKKQARKTRWKIDKILLDSVEGFSVVWFSILGVAISTNYLPFNATITNLIHQAVIAILLGTLTLLVSQLLVRLLREYSVTEDGVYPLTSLFEFLIKVVIYSLGILIILQAIGIQITPLLTAFGIGGVSLGLALQGTLANLMSGITIITSKKVKPGDYIQLRSGEAGYVEDVDLKYTVIREITDNLIIIPNSELLSTTFKNYNLPEKEMLVPVEVRVSYESDLEQAERITAEVAAESVKNFAMIENKQETPESNSKLDHYQPIVRYQKFDDFSINLTVYLKIRESEPFEHIALKHQFIKRLHRRYRQEGIRIPFPLKMATIYPTAGTMYD